MVVTFHLALIVIAQEIWAMDLRCGSQSWYLPRASALIRNAHLVHRQIGIRRICSLWLRTSHWLPSRLK